VTDELGPESKDSSTWDHLWRFVGWGLFFGLGWLDIVLEYEIDWYYRAACAFIAEREFAMIMLRKHGTDFLPWKNGGDK